MHRKVRDQWEAECQRLNTRNNHFVDFNTIKCLAVRLHESDQIIHGLEEHQFRPNRRNISDKHLFHQWSEHQELYLIRGRDINRRLKDTMVRGIDHLDLGRNHLLIKIRDTKSYARRNTDLNLFRDSVIKILCVQEWERDL
jgi:hypothetical protein